MRKIYYSTYMSSHRAELFLERLGLFHKGVIMAYAQSIRLVPETIRSLAFGSIINTHTGIGTEITNPIRILRVQNLTNAILWFSYDGVNDHEALAANSFLLLDIASNKTGNHGFFLAEGTRIYVRRNGIPTSGAVYVTVYYGAE